MQRILILFFCAMTLLPACTKEEDMTMMISGPDNGNPGDEITFTAQMCGVICRDIPYDSNRKLEWDFGDLGNDISRDASISHTYYSRGTFRVTVYLKDDQGVTYNSADMQIVID